MKSLLYGSLHANGGEANVVIITTDYYEGLRLCEEARAELSAIGEASTHDLAVVPGRQQMAAQTKSDAITLKARETAVRDQLT